MEQPDKLISKIRARPPEANFDDVRNLLEAFGWQRANEKGSHVTFRKPGERATGGAQVSRQEGKARLSKRNLQATGVRRTMTTTRRSLEEYLRLQYPFNVIADADGGYVIVFPDLPGCMTQVESLDELPAMAEEARQLWIETEYEDGHEIPLPSYEDTFSGKFVVRLPRSLHRSLVESAQREGVSLNQYVATLLARRDSEARVERRLAELEARLRTIRRSVTIGS
jgi:antitoxin HicB